LGENIKKNLKESSVRAAFFLFNLLILTNICFAAKIDIKSNPVEAEILIYFSENSPPQKIGKTPFTYNLEELINTYVKKNSFIIELRKDGFEPYKILFSKTSNLDVELSVNLEVNKDISTIKKHDQLIVEIFDVQKLIRGKNFTDALGKLNNLEKDYPHFSIISELKGTTYYMMKDIEKALSQYRKAFALNSDNVDAYKMKVYLEKRLGIDTEKN
jgi:tetratricopeptide (TPR) repeat protein